MAELPNIVFIIGTGRCGSSVLYRLLANHPRIGWMTQLCDRWPRSPGLNRTAVMAARLPLVGGWVQRHFEPSECYRFFDVSYPGFSAPVRDLSRSDVTAKVARHLRNRLPAILPANRTTLVVKLTGWPRIGFLAELFPQARFIHLVRDGRAVANSLLQVPWWHGWQGPNSWRFGPLPIEYEMEWKAHGRSFVALAAIEWKLIMDALEHSRGEVNSDQLINVRYEDLCANSRSVMRTVVSHMGLDWAPTLDGALRYFPLENRNSKWRDELGEHGAEVVTRVLRSALPKHGYEPDPAPSST